MAHENRFRETRSHVHPRRKRRFYNEEEKILSRMVSKFVGLLILVLFVFLTISFVSYVFTYQNDQIIVESHFKNFSFDYEDKIKNWGGLSGAVLSYTFIYKYFGFISSLVILFLIFAVGAKLARLKSFAQWDVYKITFQSLLLIFVINSCIGIFHLGNFFNGNFSGFLSDVIANVMFQYFGFGTYFIVALCSVIFLWTSFKGYFKKKNVEVAEAVVEEKKEKEEKVEDVEKSELKDAKEEEKEV